MPSTIPETKTKTSCLTTPPIATPKAVNTYHTNNSSPSSPSSPNYLPASTAAPFHHLLQHRTASTAMPPPPPTSAQFRLHHLPPDLLLSILSHLPPPDLAHLTTALPLLTPLTQSPHIWRTLYTRHFPSLSPYLTITSRGIIDWRGAYIRAVERREMIRSARQRGWGGKPDASKARIRVLVEGNIRRIVAADTGNSVVWDDSLRAFRLRWRGE